MQQDQLKRQKSAHVITVLVVLGISGVIARLAFQDLPNFSPVAAIALFAGFYSRDLRLAFALPVIVMAVSDLFIGSYDYVTMIVVYTLLALPAVFGTLVAKRTSGVKSVPWLAVSSLSGSVCFFVGSNLAVFFQSGMYEPSMAGLLECLTLALPFFKYTISGDIIFGCVLFVTYAAATSVARGTRPSHSTAVDLEQADG